MVRKKGPGAGGEERAAAYRVHRVVHGAKAELVAVPLAAGMIQKAREHRLDGKRYRDRSAAVTPLWNEAGVICLGACPGWRWNGRGSCSE